MRVLNSPLARRYRCAGSAASRLTVSLILGVVVVFIGGALHWGAASGYVGLGGSVVYLVVSGRRGLACGLAGRAPEDQEESSRLNR